MATIDADTHVIEGDDMFEYMTKSERQCVRHVTVEEPDGTFRGAWVIDGQLQAPLTVGDEIGMTRAVREFSDIPARLKQMDEYGTDVQVLYPTMFLRPPTVKPAVELALCRSYNRWLAERVPDGKGRFQWAIVPPLLSLADACDEIRTGAANGAKAVFWRGFEDGRLPTDAHFNPVLRAIDDCGLALCVHAGNGTALLVNFMPNDKGIWRSKLAGVTAFHALLSSDIPARYPNIRFGFVELAAQWIPYVLKDHILRVTPSGRSSLRERDSWKEIDASTLMAEKRMYVACQTNDDLSYLLTYAGSENLISGSDFGHVDTSSELLALQRIRETPGVEPHDLDNILDANPRALYAL